MNELSPRRYPRSPAITPPRWNKPEEVMKKRKIRLKENALLARINKSPRQEDVSSALKRKNPFRCLDESQSPLHKKIKEDSVTIGENSLLEIFGVTESQQQETPIALNTPLAREKSTEESNPFTIASESSLRSLPVDWTLRMKMRFISTKPFPWSLTLKTCEEASGITGFVRCLDWNRAEPGLDTSPNGRFHQSCLVWLQPNLPWLQVFPRHNLRKIGKPSQLFTDQQAKEALHKDWANSFRSLFQLLRARHCPYFYMIANSFTCLFRAAGINGAPETTASISPTTRGFRKLLTDEGISFKQPLKSDKEGKRHSSGRESNEDSGEEELEDDEKSEQNDWLASLGIQETELCTIRETQDSSSIKKEEKEDGIDESLVRVDGCEAQALFNLLINCKSVIASTGPLAGIPPTLISPVAFPGATLTPLKVHESSVKQDNERYHSFEVRGPILPNTVLNLCSILEEALDTFSVTFANIDSTKAFTLVKEDPDESKSPLKQTLAFNQGGLADSGLDSKLLPLFCSTNSKTIDSIKYRQGYAIS